MSFAENIKSLREAHGYTQAELANLLELKNIPTEHLVAELVGRENVKVVWESVSNDRHIICHTDDVNISLHKGDAVIVISLDHKRD